MSLANVRPPRRLVRGQTGSEAPHNALLATIRRIGLKRRPPASVDIALST